MTAEIRTARAEDAGAIHRINCESFGYHFPAEDTARRLRDILQNSHNRVFVAEREGSVVGYLHMADYDCTYHEPLKNILAFGVDPALQRRGIGRLLLEAAESWARADGAAGVRLVSGFNREEAHRFYLACGYTDRKNQKNFIKFFE